VNIMESDVTTINRLSHKINAWATNKGWNQNYVPFPEFIALTHSELSEALEHWRDGNDPQTIFYKHDHDTENIDKPDGIPIELADVLIRVFHYCAQHHIDIGNALKVKMEYNGLRKYRHGGKKI
jgi:NTP pyrophosphatase (non-canonical NTP hydrolase)